MKALARRICTGCGATNRGISFHDYARDPEPGEGIVCSRCGALQAYGERLQQIAPDAATMARWRSSCPEMFKHMQVASALTRTSIAMRRLVLSWRPGAGLLR